MRDEPNEAREVHTLVLFWGLFVSGSIVETRKTINFLLLQNFFLSF